MSSTFIAYWQQLVGSAPAGSETLEYLFSSLAALLLIVLVFKFLFVVVGLFNGRK